MALFNRKKSDSVLPEIDKYYDGERRDRAGLAWLLAMVSVIAVTLIVIGIFLAGRWAYRELTDDNGDVAVVENENGDEEVIPDFDGVTPPSEGDQAPAPSDEAPNNGDEEVTIPEDEEEQGSVDAPARTDTPSTPVTGDDPLPSTGPANIASVFIGVSSVAGGAHYIVTRKRQK